jgi:hypothetical protein
MTTITTSTRSVEGMRPGPALAAVDLPALDEFEVVEVLKAARRLASWAVSLECVVRSPRRGLLLFPMLVIRGASGSEQGEGRFGR